MGVAPVPVPRSAKGRRAARAVPRASSTKSASEKCADGFNSPSEVDHQAAKGSSATGRQAAGKQRGHAKGGGASGSKKPADGGASKYSNHVEVVAAVAYWLQQCLGSRCCQTLPAVSEQSDASSLLANSLLASSLVAGSLVAGSP